MLLLDSVKLQACTLLFPRLPRRLRRAVLTWFCPYSHPRRGLSASLSVPDGVCAPADEDFAEEGSGLDDVSLQMEAVARVLAAIRMWPELPPTTRTTAECVALAATCLEQGVGGRRPELLVQAAQALSVPGIKESMCACSQPNTGIKHLELLELSCKASEGMLFHVAMLHSCSDSASGPLQVTADRRRMLSQRGGARAFAGAAPACGGHAARGELP